MKATKSADFFKSKAVELKSQLEELEEIEKYTEQGEGTLDLASQDWVLTPKTKTPYDLQHEEIKEIRFQVQLLFREFDQGEPFLNRLDENTDMSFLFENQKIKNHIIHILNLFVQFIEDYRE